ncbi:MAG: hypothetical protein KC912_01280 [Proteobacteria bacterium]|nr:hypothetical protein [Pseudomonadota bacterium]
MTHHHKMFTALVLQGALLGACYEEEDETPTTDDAATDSATQDTSDTSSDTDTNTGTCADAVCEDTDQWTTCLADGVLCCWATGECCEPCCGHLDP